MSKHTKLFRKCEREAKLEFELFNSKFQRRFDRATPVIKKMKQSEFFYWNYPYKKTQIIDFIEVSKLWNGEVRKPTPPFITNRIKRSEKFLKAPKKNSSVKKIQISDCVIKNLFPNSGSTIPEPADILPEQLPFIPIQKSKIQNTQISKKLKIKNIK